MISNNNQNDSALQTEENHINRRTLWSLLAAIFLISFSLLAFEITLARILSVVLNYHYVFLVVSLTLLGLGTGGIFVHFFRPRIPRGDSRFGSLALFASLFSLSIPLSVLVMTRLAYIDNLVVGLLLYFLFLFAPFFFAGALLAEVFRMFPDHSSRIYGADLAGAAIGSLAVILTLTILGDVNSSLFFALIVAVAALLIVLRTTRTQIKRIILPAVSFVIMFVLLGTNLIVSYLPNVPMGTNPSKEISQYLEIFHGPYESAARGEIIETRWSAFGRTDLIEPRDDTELMILYIDGTAGTPMLRFSGDFDNPSPYVLSLKTYFEGYLPFLHLPEKAKDNALIIGPGGGRDILVTRLGGVDEITAVEVNRELVEIVQEYAWYNGGIYTDLDNMSIVVDEGRNFLKRQNEKYDIIMLSLVVTRTSRTLEGFALTENYLYTTESIDDYIEHLTDEGRLIIVTHSPIEVSRILAISLAALEQRGIDNTTAMQQIYIVGSEMMPVFVLKKTPFDSGEMQALYQSIDELGYDTSLAYLPTIEQGNYDSYIENIVIISKGQISFDDLEERSLQEFGVDISPVTDNSPFFYKFGAGMPPTVPMVFWASVAILSLVILVPFVYYRKRKSSNAEGSPQGKIGFNKTLLRTVVFFSMLGIGFMLVEISTIQRLILFLGQPVLSLAVLLFSLLIGAGLGSMYSNRFTAEQIVRVIAIVGLLIVGLLIIYTFLLPFIFNQLLGLALAVRLLATVAVLIPLGFLMGFPFPLGLRLLKEMEMGDYIPWMWGINGVASVFGSVLTLVIAISFGFTEALLLGASCYFVVFLVFQTTRQQKIQSERR